MSLSTERRFSTAHIPLSATIKGQRDDSDVFCDFIILLATMLGRSSRLAWGGSKTARSASVKPSYKSTRWKMRLYI